MEQSGLAHTAELKRVNANLKFLVLKRVYPNLICVDTHMYTYITYKSHQWERGSHHRKRLKLSMVGLSTLPKSKNTHVFRLCFEGVAFGFPCE